MNYFSFTLFQATRLYANFMWNTGAGAGVLVPVLRYLGYTIAIGNVWNLLWHKRNWRKPNLIRSFHFYIFGVVVEYSPASVSVYFMPTCTSRESSLYDRPQVLGPRFVGPSGAFNRVMRYFYAWAWFEACNLNSSSDSVALFRLPVPESKLTSSLYE